MDSPDIVVICIHDGKDREGGKKQYRQGARERKGRRDHLWTFLATCKKSGTQSFTWRFQSIFTPRNLPRTFQRWQSMFNLQSHFPAMIFATSSSMWTASVPDLVSLLCLCMASRTTKSLAGLSEGLVGFINHTFWFSDNSIFLIWWVSGNCAQIPQSHFLVFWYSYISGWVSLQSVLLWKWEQNFRWPRSPALEVWSAAAENGFLKNFLSKPKAAS